MAKATKTAKTSTARTTKTTKPATRDKPSNQSPLDDAVERIDRGETAWSDEVVQVEFKKPLDKVIPVRLSDDHWRQLRREAQELGVGPSTLLRMWVLEKLRDRRASHVA